MRFSWLTALLLLALCSAPLLAQSGKPPAALPTSYGTLSQNDLALRVSNDDVEIRFVPLDPRIMGLLANDAFQSLQGLVDSRRRQIDSVASRAGVTAPGLALVSFFGQRSDARFDPQTLALLIRTRYLRPLGVIPITGKFLSQQLGVREQVSAIYLFEEDIPVTDRFNLSYGALVSADWNTKLAMLDQERARVSARARGQTRDTPR